MIKCTGQVVPLSPFSQEEKAHYKMSIMANISEGQNPFFVPVPMPCVATFSGIYFITKMNGLDICDLKTTLLIHRHNLLWQNPKRRSVRVCGEKFSNLHSPKAHPQSL